MDWRRMASLPTAAEVSLSLVDTTNRQESEHHTVRKGKMQETVTESEVPDNTKNTVRAARANPRHTVTKWLIWKTDKTAGPQPDSKQSEDSQTKPKQIKKDRQKHTHTPTHKTKNNPSIQVKKVEKVLSYITTIRYYIHFILHAAFNSYYLMLTSWGIKRNYIMLEPLYHYNISVYFFLLPTILSWLTHMFYLYLFYICKIGIGEHCTFFLQDFRSTLLQDGEVCQDCHHLII